MELVPIEEEVLEGEEVEEQSEFGAGLVVCLAKFSEHLWGGPHYNDMDILRYANYAKENPGYAYDAQQDGLWSRVVPSVPEDLRRIVQIMDPMADGDVDRHIHMAIEMWMNGASDHFYDLDRDKAPAPLIELADLALDMGHGFMSEKLWTVDDLQRVRQLWKESCLELDKRLGTEPNWGAY